jgi:hypothetical protein
MRILYHWDNKSKDKELTSIHTGFVMIRRLVKDGFSFQTSVLKSLN